MGDLYEELRTRLSHDLMQVALRALLLILMLWVCAKLFLPFAPLWRLDFYLDGTAWQNDGRPP